MHPFGLGMRFDDPVERMLSFHRRLERQLAALARLPVQLESSGMGAEASAAAAGLLHCFGAESAMHHAEEELELLPMLERRIATARERDEFRALQEDLHADHRELQRLWRSLRRPLEAMAEGLERRLPADEIRAFRALCTTHISAEEASLHVLAARHLLPRDMAVLAQRMDRRRDGGLRAS
jgi:pyridoxamine 5'-phosphate oxidase